MYTRADACRRYNRGMTSLRFFEHASPTLGQRVYVDPAATVIGDVWLGDDVSVWPGAVIRGDVHQIRVGARSNIQDGAVLHVTHDGPFTPGGHACLVGEDVTVGHGALVHACTLEDACLIGMHATVLDGAIVRRHAMVAAGALVPPGKVVGEGELWLGNPARRVRKLDAEAIRQLDYSAAHYVRLKNRYLDSV